MSAALQPYGLQQARLPCPSLSAGVCSNSCPLSRWCCLTISTSASPFSFCLQSFPASESFPLLTLRIRWPQYWSFSFSISPSNEHSGFISFRFGCLDLLAVQGTFKSLLQHHSSKASILQFSAFFMLHVSCLYAAAAAESLQSCPTLRDPVDCSLPGSSVHGILQARVLEWREPL